MGDMQQFDLMTLSFAQMQQIKKQMEEVRLLMDFSLRPLFFHSRVQPPS